MLDAHVKLHILDALLYVENNAKFVYVIYCFSCAMYQHGKALMGIKVCRKPFAGLYEASCLCFFFTDCVKKEIVKI